MQEKVKCNPKVSVVILNWNGLKYIHSCINSVLYQTYKNIEVLFVDNASTDASLIECKNIYKSIRFIENSTNVGFAKGMNIGISEAVGEFILLLNTDVYLKEDYIYMCVNDFLNDEMVGCVSGYEYVWFNNERSNIKAFSGTYGLKKRLQVSSTNIESNSWVFGVSGSFPMFSSKAIEDIIDVYGSFFDESFETGWEDNDLRFRFVFRNWKTKLSNTIAWHVGSAAALEKKKLVDKDVKYQIRIFRNRFIIKKKYISLFYPRWNMMLNCLNLIIPFYYLITKPKSFYAYILGYFQYCTCKSKIALDYDRIKSSMIVDRKIIYKFIIGF